MVEFWDLYDRNRKKTFKIHQRGVPMTEDEYHLVVSAVIKNDEGKLLITKRHPNKTHPNLWEFPGGAVIAGEQSLKGAIREVEEEIGITLPKEEAKLLISERRDTHHDFYDVWLFHANFDLKDLVLQPDEVTDAKWVTQAELETLYQLQKLVPSLDFAF